MQDRSTFRAEISKSFTDASKAEKVRDVDRTEIILGKAGRQSTASKGTKFSFTEKAESRRSRGATTRSKEQLMRRRME